GAEAAREADRGKAANESRTPPVESRLPVAICLDRSLGQRNGGEGNRARGVFRRYSRLRREAWRERRLLHERYPRAARDDVRRAHHRQAQRAVPGAVVADGSRKRM